MKVNTTPINTGLVRQNDINIPQIKAKFSSSRSEKGESLANNMRLLSDDEISYRRNEVKSIQLNVSSSELINNQYSQTGSNVTYNVDGVLFTNEEMSDLKSVIKNALDFIPTKGSDLDYIDYASMGIAKNTVSTYSSEHLSKEQASIVGRSFDNYINSMLDVQQKRLSGDEYSSIEGENDRYYKTARKLEINPANALISQVKGIPNMSEEGQKVLLKNINTAINQGGKTSSASDMELALKIKDEFSKIDLKDDESISKLISNYEGIVTPAYQEWGLKDYDFSQTLSRRLLQDRELLLGQMMNAKAVINRTERKNVNIFL